MDNIDFKGSTLDTKEMVHQSIDENILISPTPTPDIEILVKQKIPRLLIAANFDLLVQTDEDSEVNNQSVATLKDEIAKLVVYLCESVQNNSTLPSFVDGNGSPDATFETLLFDDGDTIMYPASDQSPKDKVSELGSDKSSKIIWKVSQTEEDITTKWKAEKILLESAIAMKNAALEKYESKSITLESEIEKLLMELMKTSELLSDTTSEVKNLKSKLESKETEIKSMKFDISQALKKIVELKKKLEEEQIVVGLVRNEKEKALDEVAILHGELKKQLTKCKDLETQCILTTNDLTNELDKGRHASKKGNEETIFKRSKMTSVNKENIAPPISFSGLNVEHSFPQMNITGPFYKCDINSDNQRTVFPGHQRNFNFCNESNITISQRKRIQQENKDDDDENDENRSTQAVPKNAPFLRIGLSRKSRIRRPLHDSTNN